MILTRSFVFVHVPKTGGNFVRELLEQHAPADWQVQRLGDHLTYADVPPSHAALPRLAFVRNPLAWYVSWFHFQQETRDDFFLEISDGGRLDFGASIQRMFKSRDALEHGEGPMLQTLWTMLGPGLDGATVGKVEELRDDLLRMLRGCCDVPDAMTAAIESLPEQNRSAHGHYSRYYDDELRALVHRKEQPIFDHFDYAWEDAGGDGG